MIKYIRLLLLIQFLIVSACSKNIMFKKHELEISTEIKSIKNSDQAVRTFSTLIPYKYNIRTFETVCDSLNTVGASAKLSTFDFLSISSEKEQLTKLSEKSRNDYIYDVESGSKLMLHVDNINTIKFYKIIKKYGYPSYYNRKWSDTITMRVGATYVLTHFDYKSDIGKKLLKLMIKEYFKGRVNESEMKHFLWNFDGRNGRPSDYLIAADRWKKI
jgi:hypothetical protein